MVSFPPLFLISIIRKQAALISTVLISSQPIIKMQILQNVIELENVTPPSTAAS